MLLYASKENLFITAVEGTGDNLFPEDEAEGCKDYMMTSLYRQDGEDIKLIDSGQMLTKDYIKDLSDDDIIIRLCEYWEINDEQKVDLLNNERSF